MPQLAVLLPGRDAGNNKTKTQKTTSSGKAQSPPISPEEMAELRQLREQLKARKWSLLATRQQVNQTMNVS